MLCLLELRSQIRIIKSRILRLNHLTSTVDTIKKMNRLTVILTVVFKPILVTECRKHGFVKL